MGDESAAEQLHESVMASGGRNAPVREEVEDRIRAVKCQPPATGFEVARQVRHDEGLAELPIVMISSRTGSKHQERAAELGVNRFLGKPFQENELLSTIDELLET